MVVTDGTKIGWHVAERWENPASSGSYGDDAVGTARHVLYRKHGEPHKFVETVYYAEHVRANNQPPVSNCPTCGRESNEQTPKGDLFTCQNCDGQDWIDPDAEPPMRYCVSGYSEIFEGTPGEDEETIRNNGPKEYMCEDNADVMWHHSEESAQRSVDRLGTKLDDSHCILY